MRAAGVSQCEKEQDIPQDAHMISRISILIVFLSAHAAGGSGACAIVDTPGDSRPWGGFWTTFPKLFGIIFVNLIG